ncbi:MAG: LysM domain-containing protein [Comamonas sp.]
MPLALALAGWAAPALAAGLAVTPAQRATAGQVAQTGVALSELAPGAPTRYAIRPGDTLWAIAGLFLRSPWRWPELWGMNLQDIRDPHLIYPGQVLYLDTTGGRARLGLSPPGGGVVDVRLSPRIRFEDGGDAPLPALPPQVIEPFLSASLIVGEGDLASAPRIVAPQDGRVMLGAGERAYARAADARALAMSGGQPRRFRIFRDAQAIRHPVTAQVLGYEAAFVGVADLVRPAGAAWERPEDDGEGGVTRGASVAVPATLIVRSVRQEVLAGDRLLPEPPPEFPRYVPHAPSDPDVRATVVAVPGETVNLAGHRQVVIIDRGRQDGLDSGTVLGILRQGHLIVDPGGGAPERVRLPDERQGVMMVFRSFERLAYALILEAQGPVAVGDQVVRP